MINLNNRKRISKLELQIPELIFNNPVALNWHHYLTQQRSILNWLWKTEWVRLNFPDLPNSARYQAQTAEYRSAVYNWPTWRIWEWRLKYKGLDEIVKQLLQTTSDNFSYPCPEISSSRRFMGSVLASIPKEVFDWAITAMDFFLTYESLYREAPPMSDQAKMALHSFNLVYNRARYWHLQLGKLEISTIELPPWASAANRHIHKLEGGKLPPFQYE